RVPRRGAAKPRSVHYAEDSAADAGMSDGGWSARRFAAGARNPDRAHLLPAETLRRCDKASARPLLLRAWELARAGEEEDLAIDAAHMVAIVEGGEQALQWNLMALPLATG